MKKIFLLALLVLGTIFAQAQACYEIVEDQGSYEGTSYGNYDSTAIDKIEWYSLDSKYYAIVYFESNYSMGYVYGGYNWSDYYDVKDAFEDADSSGKAFWAYIEPYRITCN